MQIKLDKSVSDICVQCGHSMKMHCSRALEAGTAKTLMANDQIRHSTADSLMLRMSCIVTLLNFVNVFLSWSTAKDEAIIIVIIIVVVVNCICLVVFVLSILISE